MTTEKKVGWLIGLFLIVLAALALLFFLRVQPMRSYLKETAGELRNTLKDMNCRIYMLEKYPTVPVNELPPRPDPCPPGPPGLVPKDPP